MKNSYTVDGDVTYIHLYSPKYGYMDTLISTDKLEKVKEFKNKWIPKWNFPELSLLIGWFGKEAWKPMKGTWHNAEWRTSEERAWLDCPRFGEDISAALKVIEKMRENKVYLDIRVWPDEYQVLPHQDENNKLIDRWIVKRPSLPEAIGKAALLAALNL